MIYISFFKDFNQMLLIFEEMEMGVLAFFQKIISVKQILHSLGNGDCVTHLSTWREWDISTNLDGITIFNIFVLILGSMLYYPSIWFPSISIILWWMFPLLCFRIFFLKLKCDNCREIILIIPEKTSINYVI